MAAVVVEQEAQGLLALEGREAGLSPEAPHQRLGLEHALGQPEQADRPLARGG